MTKKRKWTEEDVKKLRTLRLQGITHKQLSLVFGCSQGCIDKRLQKMGMAGAISHEWPLEKIELLKQYWAEGKTAKAISIIMDTTRSSIIGKAHRLKLAPRVWSPRTNEVKVKEKPPKKVENAVAVEPEMLNSISMSELNRLSCRWPIGDPKTGLKFCPEKKDGRRMYCVYHSSKAYQPPQKRMR